MARSDYAHWNEEQDLVWWQEEGRHADTDRESAYDPDDFLPGEDAMDAFWEDHSDMDVDELRAALEQQAGFPKAQAVLRQLIAEKE